MYAARLVVVLLLIVAVVVAYSPQGRAQLAKVWEQVGPAALNFMDSLYAAVRNLVTGHGARDHMEQTPVPAPGGDFERIVTMSNDFSL